MHGKVVGPVSDEARANPCEDPFFLRHEAARRAHGNDFITSDFAHEFGIYGPPSYCVDQLSQLVELGVDRFILAGGPDLAMPWAEIAALADAYTPQASNADGSVTSMALERDGAGRTLHR